MSYINCTPKTMLKAIGDFLTLWRLSKARLRSQDDYQRFQAFQCSLILQYLRGHGVEISGKTVLDLGSGVGGYSVEMARQGANVISLDLIRPQTAKRETYPHIIANALDIPLRGKSVDFVFCASLIEHVDKPARLLKEIWRILSPGSYCYLSFPPFYSIRGGHEFSPFHYLGENCAIRMARYQRRHPEWVRELFGASPNPVSFATDYQSWGLFKMTIGKARGLIVSAGFQIVDISTRYFPINFARWPLLGEVLTWHVQFLLRKPEAVGNRDLLHKDIF